MHVERSHAYTRIQCVSTRCAISRLNSGLRYLDQGPGARAHRARVGLPTWNAIDAKCLAVPLDFLPVCELCKFPSHRGPVETAPPFHAAKLVIRPLEVGVGDVFSDLLWTLVADELQQRCGVRLHLAWRIRVKPFDANAPAFGARFRRQAFASAKRTGTCHQFWEGVSASGGGHRFGRRI